MNIPITGELTLEDGLVTGLKLQYEQAADDCFHAMCMGMNVLFRTVQCDILQVDRRRFAVTYDLPALGSC